jgi:hypothetical protein
MWQVAGLSILWYIGSSQSKEGDDRLEDWQTVNPGIRQEVSAKGVTLSPFLFQLNIILWVS